MTTVQPPADAGAPRVRRQPLYWRVLVLRHVRPNGWQRAILFEGALATATVLVLADLASAWLLIALPLVVAVVVKAHDLLAGLLEPVVLPSDSTTAPSEPDDAVEESVIVLR